MSQSPELDQSAGVYEAGWEATLKLVREGRTWSGRERNCAFLNTGPGRFANVSAITGLDYPDDGRAVGIVDWDQDGDLDLWLRNRSGPRLRLMLNGLNEPGRSVQIRLTGRKVNRDAIGARVELKLTGQEDRPLVRTVVAGDGFRSQGSKWLHFGLGDGAEVAGVVVRWPGGPTERFPGVDGPGRFRLVEGEGRAVRVDPLRRTVKLRPGGRGAPEERTAARAILSRRIPRIALPFTNFDGSGLASVRAGRPVLLNLWASWCGPCAAELQELRDRKDDLAARGVDVYALSIEALDPDGATTSADAERFVRQLDFPHRTGLATLELVEKLELLEDAWFPSKTVLVVPMSLLLDAEGRLAAIYRGKVAVDDVLADLPLLELEGEALRDRALPFAGRWFIPLRRVESQLMVFAAALQQAYPEDAARVIEPALRYYAALRRAKGANPQLDADQATAHVLMGESLRQVNRFEMAGQHYRAAAQFDPNNAAALNGLGIMLSMSDRPDQAIDTFRQALRVTPEDANIHGNLGLSLMLSGHVTEALPHFERAIELDPALAEVQYYLGTALSVQGRTGDALAAFRRAVELTGGQDATILDSLGAALAEVGRFGEAVSATERALAAARTEGNLELVGLIEQRLADYRAGRPHRVLKQ